jgi:DNA-binding transcriptional ArsR family regulator
VHYAALRYVIEGDNGLEGAAWQVAVVIAYRADRHTGDCFASVRSLARSARLARSTVEQALTRLRKSGVVAVVLEPSGRRSTCYRIVGFDPPPSVPPIGTQRLRSVPPAGPLQRPSVPIPGEQPNSVVSRSTTRSVPIHDPVVSRFRGVVYKEGREELEGVKGNNGAAPPSPPAQDAADSAAPQAEPHRCRHRNDPDTCGLCSDAVGASPPRAALDELLGRKDSR